jgi:hypothetical protein
MPADFILGVQGEHLAGSVNSCIEVNVDFSEIVVVDDCLEVD